MADIVTTTFIGRHTRRLTDAALETLRQYTKGLGYVPLDEQLRFPASIFPIELDLATQPNDSVVEGIPVKIPFPIKVWAIDFACKTAGGTTLTLQIQRIVVGGAYALIHTAAQDVKTGANAYQRVTPTEAGALLDYTDEIKLIATAVGAGVVTGCKAILWCQCQ